MAAEAELQAEVSFSMQTGVAPRVRKRVPCTIEIDGGRHRGLVLNLSSSGLFVQTGLPAVAGTSIAIDLSSPLDDEAIVLSGTVVWRRRISPRMIGINQSGMGVRLDSTPAAWTALIRESSSEVDVSPGESAAEPGIRFVVRLAHAGSPRTRRAIYRCASEEEARARASAEAGAGWEILELWAD